MILRDETPADIDAIAALVAAAFKQAQHASGAEAAIIQALRDTGALALGLVAECDGRLAGYVAFSPVTIDGQDRGWFGLGPVAVLPELQRRGVGAALIREGLSRLQASGARGCVVLGDPAYYGRFGFEADPAMRYGGAPPEFFMRLGFDDARAHGDVRYHPGFDAH